MSFCCEQARDIVVRGGKPIELVSQVASYGLAVILQSRCAGFKRKFSFNTSPKLQTNGNRHFDVNYGQTWGAIASGNGMVHMNEFLCTLDSPTLSQSFSSIETEINHWCKDLLDTNFTEATEEEKIIQSK